MRIAIVGSGIAGLGAAHLLSPVHEVTVFEADARPGGHANTIDVDYDGAQIAVDTGFIVYNELNYPNLTALFERLGVETIASAMSFAVSRDHGRFEWGGDTLATLFAQKRNIVNPRFWSMVREILRFNRVAAEDLAAGRLGATSLGDYLRHRRFGPAFTRDYLLPMAAAIWSTPLDEMLDFPAASFIAFFDNHCLLKGFDGRPVWRTVRGGSRRYVEKLTAPLGARLRLATPVIALHREADGVALRHGGGETEVFDHVILACHGDQSARLLADADAEERDILGRVRYSDNRAYVHRDPRLMPRRKKVWSAWNYIAESGTEADRPVTVSYWMNRLQDIDSNRPLFITLNPSRPPRAEKTFAVIDYAHPQFDRHSLDVQAKLDRIQGRGGVWYCGAWTGHGFHEDGLVSGLGVAERLGARRAWDPRARAAAAE